ncbi:MAG: hypothetical protein ACLFUF_06540 [Opitutales bacterium]
METLNSSPALFCAIYRCFAHSLALLFLAALLSTGLLHGQSTDDAATESDSEETIEDEEQEREREREQEWERPEKTDKASLKLIKNHLRASGGRDKHLAVKSIHASGTIEEAGREKKFNLVETRDGRRRIDYTWTYKGRKHAIARGYNGETAWEQNLLPEKELPKSLGEVESRHFSRQHWLLHPFVGPLHEKHVFEYKGKARVAGRKAYMIVGYGPDNIRSWYYFDKEKFLLVRHGGNTRIGNSQSHLDYRSSKFRRINGVLWPQDLTLLAKDSPFGAIVFDTIQINETLDAEQFNRPPDGIPVLRQRSK